LKGDFDLALENYQKGLAIIVAEFDEDHFNAAVSETDIGKLYLDTSKYKEAFKYLQKSVEKQEKIDKDHVNLAKYLDNLGKAYMELS